MVFDFRKKLLWHLRGITSAIVCMYTYVDFGFLPNGTFAASMVSGGRIFGVQFFQWWISVRGKPVAL